MQGPAFPCFPDAHAYPPQGLGVAPFEETTRDTHTFSRRVGDLPVQREGEELDFRGALHRDGTVYSAVSLEDLKTPEVGADVGYLSKALLRSWGRGGWTATGPCAPRW